MLPDVAMLALPGNARCCSQTSALPCPLTAAQDPVILPDSRVTIDRPTIERHLLSSQTDPFRWAVQQAGQAGLCWEQD